MTDAEGPAIDLADRRRARNLLWLVFALVGIAVGIGGSWDAEYHKTQPFDGFFSPPHIFIYSVVSLMLGVVAYIALNARTRRCFGATVDVPVLGPVPGALVLLGGACTVLAVAAPLDATWHTAFGLDETRWSFPHAMLGAALALLAVGIASCRRVLAEYLPIWPITHYVLGYLLVYALSFVMGPLLEFQSTELAAAVAGRGALARDADVQHVVRIVTEAQLTASNPAFPLLAGLWCGVAIMVLRGVDSRARYWLVVAVLVALSINSNATAFAEELGLSQDGASSTGLPFLTALIGFMAAYRLRLPWRLAVAGAAMAVHATAVWGGELPVGYVVAAALTPVATVAGGMLGTALWDVVARPARLASVVLVLVIGVGIPLVTGTIDLILRTAIP